MLEKNVFPILRHTFRYKKSVISEQNPFPNSSIPTGLTNPDILHICLTYAKGMPNLCQNISAKDILQICPIYAPNIPNMAQYTKYLINLCPTYLKYPNAYVPDKPNICQKYAPRTFTDPIVTDVCDIGLGKGRSPSVTDGGILTFR